MALDAEKKPLEVIASNPGQLLFTRIINNERARVVANRLMRDDMFSGWGWRTMSQEERVFNPLSYHRGSVWPHDNSLIAHGMALNEMRDGALRILTSLYQAASNFRDYRLPELFCGVQRREYDEPVQYPVSCSPQAWASGAMFLILCFGAGHSSQRAAQGTEHHQPAAARLARSPAHSQSANRLPAASASTSAAAAIAPSATWSTWKATSCW